MADRRQQSHARRSFATLIARWKSGSTVERATMATFGALAAIVVIALVVAIGNLISARVELSEAKARQVELTEAYDFNPGDIISDSQFFDGDAMDETQVQTFLDEQGAACTKDSCLRARRFKVERREANDYCREYPGSKRAQSAAAIITAASQACDVSPKVLLTVLQKEQQLVTATNPKEFQFKSAMGLSCPDDDHCDPEYAGFFKQVFGSAERYQYYVRHEDRYDFHAGRLNFVRFNPDVACGGANVYIENKATALLYIYTPYQPNDAALAAGAGEGDSCSTYGNRNFSIIYSNWFGDPRQ
ncbi:hemagglutinin [Bifidobacterium anseris]|uniref:hemagglutinin n=1 Tax=Bifidobacterium TaxID=1678 RepID=UPI003C2D2845